jgi:putative nucleotidyltransferase with HDIG domain
VTPAPGGLAALPHDLQAMIAEAQATERQGRRAAARELYEQALRRLREPAHAPAAAALLRWVGRTYSDEADVRAARDCFEASLAVATAVGDQSGIAHVINLMAITCQQQGELDEAERLYRRALESAELAGESRLVAMIEQNRGTIASIRGELHDALQRYQAALDGYLRLSLDAPVSGLLNNLGQLYTFMRRWRAAEESYDEAYALSAARGDVSDQILVEANRAELWIARRCFDNARGACDNALALAERVGDMRVLGDMHKNYGIIARETGDYDTAEEHFSRARRIAEERHDLLLAAQTAREQADMYWRQRRNRDTLRALNQAHRLFSQLRARLDLDDVRRRMGQLEEMFLEIVGRWGASIESKDRYTQGHCERVADYACALARAVGIDESTLFWFRAGALLHDVGKLIVPSSVLNKSGPLTPEERSQIERHPVAGVELLGDIDFPWDIRPMIRYHHERWDGSGYPEGLAREAIPLSARILCIADVYDALTTTRSYRPAYPRERALEIMRADVGRLFDPALFPQFVALVEAQFAESANGTSSPASARREAIAV